MHLSRYDDATQFHARVEPFLLAHEAAHCLSLGILNTLLQRPDAWGAEPPYLALVEDEGAVAAVALRTPPYNPIISLIAPEAADEALARFAADLRACYRELPGVFGPTALSRAFADQWQALTGRSFRLSMKQRVYQLDRVIPVTGVAGQMRRASEGDRALLERWTAAFFAEALGDREPEDAAHWVENALATGTRVLFLWEDSAGQPVSLAGYGGPTPNGMRIGPVYTPPEHRRHGYASAITAALSQVLLDGGRRYCFLFTDLANPTSNAIYQAIGYRPVVEVDMYTFADD